MLHVSVVIFEFIIQECIFFEGVSVFGESGKSYDYDEHKSIPHSAWKINDIENTFSLICFTSETWSNALTHRPLGMGGPSDLDRRDGVPLRSPDCKKLKWIQKCFMELGRLYFINNVVTFRKLQEDYFWLIYVARNFTGNFFCKYFCEAFSR